MWVEDRNEVHVMIDLETLSSEPDAAVIAIGATRFNYMGLTPDQFYARIKPQDAERYGSVSKETMLWWDKVENTQARAEAFGGTATVSKTVYDFQQWLEALVFDDDKDMSIWDNLFVWANGADFDLPILKNLFHECTGNYPINFRNHRCYRTIKSLYMPSYFDDIENSFKHNALEDAKYQALVIVKCLNNIRECAWKAAR